jgi:mycothiol synthase
VVSVEAFQPQDAADVAALISRLYPDRALDADELQRLDRDQQEAGHLHGRAVLRAPDGTLAGFAGYAQQLGQFHPRKFVLELIVAPEHRNLGHGAALYDWLLTELQPRDPLALRVSVREDDVAALQFASSRGYREDRRYWVSSIDPAQADLSSLPERAARLESQGVVLLSAAELAQRDPQGWQARLHALFSEVRLDVPRSEPPTPISLDQYRAWVLDDEGYLPSAHFLAELVAEASGELIGTSDLYRSPASPDLFTGLSAVRRPWRGLGIATVLKLQALQYAQSQGVPRVWTDNESGNAPILKINDRLGFVREPALVGLVWHRPEGRDVPRVQ